MNCNNKERPILFSGPMVQAILAGRKTQTRRIISSPSQKHDCIALVDYGHGFWPYLSDDGESSITDDGNETPIKCPYGAPGVRLWVRETFALWREGFDRRGHVVYRADMKDKAGEDFSRPDLMGLSKWYPSIHMKRVYSRITLEITEIRVQRLQEISEEDAKAEGVSVNLTAVLATEGRASASVCHTSAYIKLWDSINGERSWAANPWVWCVSFKRVQP
jgi:hypothetical protein